jgi:hypothetical protein
MKTEWQPFATAPRDGTQILCMWGKDYSDFSIGDARHELDDEGYSWWVSGDEWFDKPDYWMPLPPIPTPSTADRR